MNQPQLRSSLAACASHPHGASWQRCSITDTEECRDRGCSSPFPTARPVVLRFGGRGSLGARPQGGMDLAGWGDRCGLR
jgi:hypothetical protein